jgi:hypothetical protein
MPVRNLVPVFVHLSFIWSPAHGVHRRHNPVNTVWGKEPVFDALLQAIGVDGIAKVFVGIPIVISQRCCGHSDLNRRPKIFEDFSPVAIFSCTPAMAFINDYQVKEIRGIFSILLDHL